MYKFKVLELLDKRDEMILAVFVGFLPLFSLFALFH